MSDWIEKLREKNEDFVRADGLSDFGRDSLWPLLCDVVEAAHVAYDGFGEDDHRFYDSQLRLADKLAALKAEVEK